METLKQRQAEYRKETAYRFNDDSYDIRMLEAFDAFRSSPLFLAMKEALEFYEKRDSEISAFQREFEDDCDSLNNEHENGYFTPRPTDDEAKEYEALLQDNGEKAREVLAAMEEK